MTPLEDGFPGNSPGDSDRDYALLRDLIAKLREGELTETEQRQLKRTLSEDAEARRIYARYAILQGLLELDAVGGPEIAGRVDPRHELSRAARADLFRSDDPPPRSPVLGFLNGLLRVGHETPMTAALMWLVMAVIASGIVLTVFFCISLTIHGVGVHVHVDGPEVAGGREQGATQPERDPLVASDSSLPAPRSLLPASSASVARLIHISEPRWAIGSHSPHVNDDLEPGRKLMLMSGLAEIMFQSGAKALLEGPATLEIGSDRSAFMRQGKVSVTVINPDLRGFEINAPGMKYTDLGTEFGVSVAKDGKQEMVVFRGQVKAEQASGMKDEGLEMRDKGSKMKDERSNPSSLIPHPSAPPLILSAHQAVRVAAPGKPVERIAADEKQFVRSGQMAKIFAEQSPEFQRWKSFRSDLRKRADLVAYFDFQPDEADRTVLRNRAATGRQFDGNISGGAEWVPGRIAGKSALQFDEKDAGVIVDIPVKLPEASVAVWMQIGRVGPRMRQIVGSDSWRKWPGQLHCHVDPQGTVSFGMIDPNCAAIEFDPPSPLFAGSSLADWHFAAFTFSSTAKIMTVYFDGQLKGRLDAGRVRDLELGKATFGNWDPKGLPGAQRRPLGGRIDELFILRKALSGEEIGRLYKGILTTD